MKILQDGYEKTKDKDEGLLYTIGDYYIDKKIDFKKGIEVLKSIQNEKHKFSGFLTKPPDDVYSKNATGYWEMKEIKNKQKYLQTRHWH